MENSKETESLVETKFLELKNEGLNSEIERLGKELKHNRNVTYIMAAIAIAFLVTACWATWANIDTVQNYEENIRVMNEIHKDQLRQEEKTITSLESQAERLRATIEAKDAIISDQAELIEKLKQRPEFVVRGIKVSPQADFLPSNSDGRIDFTITIQTADNMDYPLKVWIDRDYKYSYLSDRYDIHVGWLDYNYWD